MRRSPAVTYCNAGCITRRMPFLTLTFTAVGEPRAGGGLRRKLQENKGFFHRSQSPLHPSSPVSSGRCHRSPDWDLKWQVGARANHPRRGIKVRGGRLPARPRRSLRSWKLHLNRSRRSRRKKYRDSPRSIFSMPTMWRLQVCAGPFTACGSRTDTSSLFFAALVQLCAFANVGPQWQRCHFRRR
jgi:hypothetical protein